MTTATRAHRWDLEEVLVRTDLRSLLDEVTQSNGRQGRAAKWHCPSPDHPDRDPSVTVTSDHRGKERWRCWSNADHRGDAIDLVRTVQGSSASEAADWLANKAGMIPDQPLPPPLPIKKRAPIGPIGLHPYVRRYVAIAQAVMRGPQGEPMRQWLTDRGIGSGVIRANHVGADVGRDLMRRRKGLPYGDGPGVVFPAFDENGGLAYIQTRYFDSDRVGRKYDNPAAELGTNPRVAFIRTPHGTPDRPSVLLVTEGIPDGLIAAQAGFSAVSIMGSQTPDSVSVARIADYAENGGLDVALVVERDTAGSQAVHTMFSQLQGFGVTPQVIDLPGELDLNDLALQTPGWPDDLTAMLHGGIETDGPVNGLVADIATSAEPASLGAVNDREPERYEGVGLER